jgi:uncharacterized protein (TIRG00374 family)
MLQESASIDHEERTEEQHTAGAVSPAAEPEVHPEQLSLRKQLLRWRTIVPLAVVIALLAFLVPHLSPDLTPQSIGAALVRANIWLFLAALVAFYASLLLRVVRWKLLLENVGYGTGSGARLPGFVHLTKILFLSWFANVVVPAKLGDLYRAYLLRQEADVSTSRSFGTVFAERIIDLIALPLFFLVALLIALHGQLPAQVELALQVCFALMLALVVGLIALRLWHRQIGRLVPARLRPQYVHFQEGTLGSFKRLYLLAPLTTGIWLVESLRFLLVALSVGLLGGSPLHIFAAAFLIALGESLLTTVPLTSGGVVFVEAGMFAMIWLFVPHTSAALNLAGATIVLDRLISLVSILVFGGILFFVVMALGKRAQSGAGSSRPSRSRKGK